MALKQPESVDECVYFTRRALLPTKGRIVAWAFRKRCPKCRKGVMAKPKKSSPTYDCPSCGYAEPKAEHIADIKLNVEYTCPACGFSGEAQTEFKRKSWQGVKAYVFSCGKCGEKIGVTKKLKEPKRKGADVPEEDDDDE
jgi:predicted RNA-binding Zn-ribbon protein involved in translation (DUF1610 family)